MRFPDRALRALSYLFRPYNDIDVYVEDSVSRNMYEVLLNRMLAGSAQITRVIQLGDRNKVIAYCEKDQLPSIRHRLYIIDGDLDLLIDAPAPAFANCHRLTVYTSENLLIDRGAVLEVAYECLTNTDRVSVEKLVDIDALLADVSQSLVSLFALYAAAHELRAGLVTSGTSVMTLFSRINGRHSLDAVKVRTHYDNTRSQLEMMFGAVTVSAAIEKLEARIGTGTPALARFVSGKSYLLPILFHHLKAVAGFTGTIEQLKVRLARYTDINLDPALLAAVLRCSRS